MDVDCHFVREKLLEGLVSLGHVSTDLLLANILTKSLSGLKHHSGLPKLSIVSQTSQFEGG